MTNENDKKMQYLERGEIKTMEKDISRLREEESKKERERIAKLKAEEEEKREKERLARAEREAAERRKAEEEIQKRKEEIKQMKEEKQKEATAAEVRESEEKEKKEERIKEKLKEIQQKEEAERIKFLERVAAKAEGRETGPAPARPMPPPIPPPKPPAPPEEKPAPEKPKTKFPKIKKPLTPKISGVFPEKPSVKFPKIKKPPAPKISGVFPEKPSVMNKVWIKVLLSLLIFAILAAVGTFWYWYFAVRGEEPAKESREEEMIPEQPAEKPEEAEKPTEPKITMPEINERILDFGYRIPQSPRTIDTIVIHTVYNALGGDVYSLEGVLDEYERYGVAAHYLIDRDGTVYQTAPEEAIAYHAGPSQMPDGRTNVNNFSIGIEAISYKDNTLTEEQYISLAGLIKHLKEKYQVPDENIVGHSDISPGRKTDPWNFDWEYFNSLIE